MQGFALDGSDIRAKSQTKLICRPNSSNDSYMQTNRHLAAGITRKEYFAVYLDEDPDEFMPEQQTLKDLGFNSVFWVCEILRKCLVWDFMAKYDEAATDADHMMAITELGQDASNPPDRPFFIKISIAVDYIWPLLIDEYTQAEKAVCTFTLASTILHELTVSGNRASRFEAFVRL